MSAKIAKKHWKNRGPSEQHMSLRQFCREVHVGCESCQKFLGKTYDFKTDIWKEE